MLEPLLAREWVANRRLQLLGERARLRLRFAASVPAKDRNRMRFVDHGSHSCQVRDRWRARERSREDHLQQLTKTTPIGRIGRPEEVADLALAILRNSYVTSQVLSIDGGMYPR